MRYEYILKDADSNTVILKSNDYLIFRDTTEDIISFDRLPVRVVAHRKIAKVVEEGILPSARKLNCLYCGYSASYWHHCIGYAGFLQFCVIPICKVCHKYIHLIKKDDNKKAFLQKVNAIQKIHAKAKKQEKLSRV